MKWTAGDRSNIEDARGRSGGMAMGAGGLGVGGLLLLLVLSWATGIDLTSMVGGGGVSPARRGRHLRRGQGLARRRKARRHGGRGHGRRAGHLAAAARRTATRTPRPCSSATRSTPPAASRSRPPGRSTVRRTGRSISISGSSTSCDRRLGAPGDFAQAYVLAHELGHHVQTLTGVEAPGPRASSRRTRARAMRCRSGWSSRPIATPASGAITPTRAAAASSSIRTTSRKASTPRPPSATTASSGCRAAVSPRNASPTAPRSSGSSGSAAAWTSGDPKACNTFQ